MASDQNETLMSENLSLLKAIAMHYVDREEHSMSVRVLNIRGITKNYYRSVSEDRRAMLLDKFRQEEEDLQQLETNLRHERQDLLNANDVLKRFFWKLRRKLMVFTVPAREFIFEYRSKEMKFEDYKELKEQCRRFEKNGKGLISLANILNNGKEPKSGQKKFLLELSRYTSHIANNSKRRVSYFSDTYSKCGSRISTRTYRLSSKSRCHTQFDTPRTESSRRHTEI